MDSDSFYLGLIAGEGCFRVKIERVSDNSIRISPKFSITMHEQSILEQFREYMGFGEVYDDLKAERYTYGVYSIDDICVIRDWIEQNTSDEFISTDKYRQYKLWSTAIDITDRNKYEDPLSVAEKHRLIDISYDIPKSDTKQKSRSEWKTIATETKPAYCGHITKGGEKCKRRVSSEDEKCYQHE